MKLSLKFSIIFVVVFGVGLAAAGFICRSVLLNNARTTVLQQARLMLETTLATREYTAKQVGPLIESLNPKDGRFHPQTIPFFAATENFNYLRTKFPEYSYKEAALNPINPRDRSVDWEADIIQRFRDDRSRSELVAERDTPTGRSLVLARPISAGAECLQCHGLERNVPASIIRRYGRANGFGWNLNEVIGAQIVSVPMSLPIHMADEALRRLMVSLLALGTVMLLSFNLAIWMMVVKPVTRLASMADEISKGRTDIPELPVKGRDEIAVLAAAFNRLYRSVAHALKMLGQQ